VKANKKPATIAAGVLSEFEWNVKSGGGPARVAVVMMQRPDDGGCHELGL
jgi:hypothetical protein